MTTTLAQPDPRLARPTRSVPAWPLACAALGLLAAAAVATRPSPAAAQPAAAAANPAGRYQVVTASRERNPLVVLVDTQTGHVWAADATGGEWTDRGTPPTGK